MEDYSDLKNGQLVKIIESGDGDFPALMIYDFEKKCLNYVMPESIEQPVIGIIVEDYLEFSEEYSEDDKCFDNFKAKMKNTLKRYLKFHDNSFEKAKSYLVEHFSWVFINNGYYFISKENLKAI